MAWTRPAAAGARFTSGYGPRRSPGGIGSTWHRGIDLAPRTPGAGGFPVLAATDGVVLAAGYSSVRGYWLVQRADDGSALRYQHFAGPTVGAGARLRAGQVLGSMGTTGAATGPHLHLEVFDAGRAWTSSANAADPEPFFRARGVDLRTGAVSVADHRPGAGGSLPDVAVDPVTPIAPPPPMEDDMYLISAPGRGQALIGPGYYRHLATPEEVEAAAPIVTRTLAGNDRQWDLWRSLALEGTGATVALPAVDRLLALVEALPREQWWDVTVRRGDENVPVIQELADIKSLLLGRAGA